MKKRISVFLSALMLLSACPVTAAAQEGAISVVIDGEKVEFSDAQPVIIDSRTLVPLRGVFERLGYDIFWKADTKTAVLADKKDNIIRISVGSNTFYKGSEPIYTEVQPQIIGSRMYLPLRAIGEAGGMTVNWDSQSKTVYIGNGQLFENDTKKDEEQEPVTELAAIEEIRSDTELSFTASVLTSIILEYDNYIAEGNTDEDFIQAVKPFVENEATGLNKEYAKKFSELLNKENNADFKAQLDKYYDEVNEMGNTAAEKLLILTTNAEEIRPEVDLAMETALSNEAFQNGLENAQTPQEKAKLNADAYKTLAEELSKLKADSNADKNFLNFYLCAAQITADYYDYIASDDFDAGIIDIFI